MDFQDDPQAAGKYARTALALIQQHKISPVPKSFAVFYAHASADYEALSAELGPILETGAAVSDEVISRLFAEHFELGREAEAIRETSEKMEKAIAAIDQMMVKASENADQYGNHLESFSDQLSEDMTVEDIRGLITDIKSQTRDMKASHETLREDLQESTLEIGGIREEMESSLEESMTDPLTGIANKRYFSRYLWEKAQAATKVGEPLSLMMVKVDAFRAFQKAHGRKVGNEVLALAGRILTNKIVEDDLAARYEGEQFAVVLPGASIEEAAEKAKAMQSAVSNHKLVSRGSGDDYGSISLSIGIALFDQVEYMPQFTQRAENVLSEAVSRGGKLILSEREI